MENSNLKDYQKGKTINKLNSSKNFINSLTFKKSKKQKLLLNTNRNLSRKEKDYKLENKQVKEFRMNELSILYAKKHQNKLDDQLIRSKLEKMQKEKKLTIEEENDLRLKNINKYAKANFIKTFKQLQVEDKLFEKNMQLEPTPYEGSLRTKNAKTLTKTIAKNIMRLEGEKLLDKDIEQNLRLDLLKEINIANNLDWMMRKNQLTWRLWTCWLAFLSAPTGQC